MRAYIAMALLAIRDHIGCGVCIAENYRVDTRISRSSLAASTDVDYSMHGFLICSVADNSRSARLFRRNNRQGHIVISMSEVNVILAVEPLGRSTHVSYVSAFDGLR
jgi:hypothetical protein